VQWWAQQAVNLPS